MVGYSVIQDEGRLSELCNDIGAEPSHQNWKAFNRRLIGGSGRTPKDNAPEAARPDRNSTKDKDINHALVTDYHSLYWIDIRKTYNVIMETA